MGDHQSGIQCNINYCSGVLHLSVQKEQECSEQYIIYLQSSEEYAA